MPPLPTPQVPPQAGVPPPGTFAGPHTYSLADLEEDRNRELVSIADLPHGHGLGDILNHRIGGGLAPGDMIAVGASRAGSGKTAFVMQLADGLALRTADLASASTALKPGPLTPVTVLSEMDAHTLARRTLGRLCGVSARLFRSGKASGEHRETVDAAYGAARAELQEHGRFEELRPWMRIARPDGRGVSVMQELAASVNEWRESLAAKHPGRSVWPVVVVDPIQRWQDPELNEVEALNTLAEKLDQLADAHGWIVLLTSDTNKDAAKGLETSNAGAFRGSYRLMHAADIAVVMKPGEYNPETHQVDVDVALEKNRNGPLGSVRMNWHSPTGQFTPETKEQRHQRVEAEKAAAPKKNAKGVVPAKSDAAVPVKEEDV